MINPLDDLETPRGFQGQGGRVYLPHILLPWEGCWKHLSPLVCYDQGVRLTRHPCCLDLKKKRSQEHGFVKKVVLDGKNASSNLVWKEGYYQPRSVELVQLWL